MTDVAPAIKTNQTVAERSGPSHSILAHCATEGCSQKDISKRVWLSKAGNGLLEYPHMICPECHRSVRMEFKCSCSND